MDLVAQLLPQIVGQALAAVGRQPAWPISVQRVALIGSSTARMISDTRVSAEPRARR
jgi:hypothetical protein